MTATGRGTGSGRCLICDASEAALWALVLGERGLQQLPHLVRDAFVLGFDDGRESRNPEFAELRAELDRLAVHAFDPCRQRRIVDELIALEAAQRFRRGAA